MAVHPGPSVVRHFALAFPIMIHILPPNNHSDVPHDVSHGETPSNGIKEDPSIQEPLGCIERV